ncbi:uncharacterized protein BP5553_00664 [Venustampulla echinocandica]|uniref:Uncharacterized protein n=1 Tax=Venustampulla echinocandica TaxID=2656787 RepID=A0A370TYT3_9HELO|nr:uncharacterized protein BP5553_00664 [Venustampulla echinocandica]RDL40685.1 hypothetical protein BP5553_00664 [Venustampulla echinocandica]
MAQASPTSSQHSTTTAPRTTSSDIKDFGYTSGRPFHCPVSLQEEEDSDTSEMDAEPADIPEIAQHEEQKSGWKVRKSWVGTVDAGGTSIAGEVSSAGVRSRSGEGQKVRSRTILEPQIECSPPSMVAETPTRDTITASPPEKKTATKRSPQPISPAPSTRPILKRLTAALHYTRWANQKDAIPRAPSPNPPISLPTNSASTNGRTKIDNGIQSRRLQRSSHLNPDYINLNNVHTVDPQNHPNGTSAQARPQPLRLNRSGLTGELTVQAVSPEAPVSVAVAEVTPRLKTVDTRGQTRQGRRARRREGCF